jgi:SAM-dependent methyltransferase
MKSDNVEKAYDEIAYEYLETKDKSTLIFAHELEQQLKPGSKILDAGCGAGIPIAKYLSKNFEVFGIDISQKQIELAIENVPLGKFKKTDLGTSGFDPEFFDGIICMYALIHVDRKRHLEILKEFYTILKEPGFLMICMGLEDWEGEEEYLGTKMFWSHYDRKTNLELLQKTGFSILWEKDWANPKDPNDRHLFVLCKK